MSTQGPNYPSAIDEVGPGQAWNDPGNAAGAPDGNTATVTVAGKSSKVLLGGPAGLGFTIPAGATINGISIQVKSRAEGEA